MKKLFLILAILLLPFWVGSVASAATYYFDNTTGDDSDSGLTEALAWKSIDKFDTTTFSAGDIIRFKKGETWDVAYDLTQQSYFYAAYNDDGTSGSRITINSYGSGNDPIIDARHNLNADSFWADQGGDIWMSARAHGAAKGTDPGFEAWTADDLDSYSENNCDASEDADCTEGVASAEVTSSAAGGYIAQNITLVANTWYYLTIDIKVTAGDSGSIRLRDADNGVWLIEDNGLTDAAWATKSYYFKTGHGNTNTQLRLYADANGDIVNFDDYVLKTSHGLFQSPDRVFVDEEGCGLAANAGAVDSTSKYYWDDTNDDLYVYATSNPGSAYSSVRVNSIFYTVQLKTIDYVDIDGIELRGGKTSCVLLEGAATNNTFQNMSISYFGQYGVYWKGTASYGSIDSNTFSYNTVDKKFHTKENRASEWGADSFLLTGGGDSNTISYNTFIDGLHNLIAITGLDAAAGGTDSNIVEHNSLSAPVSNYCRAFSFLGYVNKCDGNIFRFNNVFDTTVQNQLGGRNNVVHNNIFNRIDDCYDTSRERGILLYTSTYGNDTECYANKIYNNVFYGCDDPAIGIYDYSGTYDVDANMIKNNIFADNDSEGSNIQIFVENNAGITNMVFDHNQIYDAGTATTISFKGTTYTVANADSGLTEFVTNYSADPLFTDAAGDDFTLLINSPCVKAGLDLGNSYDDALDPSSTWPDGVTTLDQDDYGWSIGAYTVAELIKVWISGDSGSYSGTIDASGFDYGLIVIGDSNAFDGYDVSGGKILIDGDSNTFDRGIIN